MSAAPPTPAKELYKDTPSNLSAPSLAALLEAPAVAPPARSLSEAQEALITAIAEHFNAPEYTLPTSEGATERLPLSEREMMFLSHECLVRFLIGTKAKLQPTIERLERALTWRRTVRIDDVEALSKDVEKESRMGKNFVLGFAATGQPVVYFFPNRNSLPLEERNALHTVGFLPTNTSSQQMFITERAIDLMPPGVTNLILIFNFHGKRSGPPTSVTAAREALHILSSYYPELLGRAVMQELPWVVRAFVSLMWPFVDPDTKTKALFDRGGGETQAINKAQIAKGDLLVECGGDLKMPYEFDTYWPALMQTCLARRAEHARRWRALGPPKVGYYERDFKVAFPPAVEAIAAMAATGTVDKSK